MRSAVSQDITRRLGGILFGFYSPDEVRKASVVEIKCLSAFDQFGNALKDGLYDPRMGVSPYERNARCVTCGQEEEHCPGHMGHIEMVLPVYNVFLVNYLHKLLRTKCLFCHKVKATEARVKHYQVMFMLLKFGMLGEYENYKKLCEIRIPSRYKTSDKNKALKHSEATSEGRKASQSTRRPSESSQGTTEEKAKHDAEKGEKVMKDICFNLEKHAKTERNRIIELLDVRKNEKRFRKGIEWNASLAAKFQ